MSELDKRLLEQYTHEGADRTGRHVRDDLTRFPSDTQVGLQYGREAIALSNQRQDVKPGSFIAPAFTFETYSNAIDDTSPGSNIQGASDVRNNGTGGTPYGRGIIKKLPVPITHAISSAYYAVVVDVAITGPGTSTLNMAQIITDWDATTVTFTSLDPTAHDLSPDGVTIAGVIPTVSASPLSVSAAWQAFADDGISTVYGFWFFADVGDGLTTYTLSNLAVYYGG